MCGGRKRAGRTMLALAATVSALLALPTPAPAAFPGSNGKIAYGGYGPSGIYRINPDGSNNELVKSGNVHNPVWSSDGTKIAYLDSGTQLRITAADGTGSTLVCTCVDSESDLTWSPDGTKFAFDKRVTGIYEIFVVNSDGTGLTQITHGATSIEFSAAPDWSPDGTKITFHRAGPSTWVMNADGSGAVDLTGATRDYDFPNPSWSPDGTKIAFNRQGGIWTMNGDGTNQTQLTIHGPGHAEDHHVTWSPDGQLLLFTGWIDDAFNSGLVVMNPDGTGTHAHHRDIRLSTARLAATRQLRATQGRDADPVSRSCPPIRSALRRTSHGAPLAFRSCTPPQQASGLP